MPLVLRGMPSMVIPSGFSTSSVIRLFDDAWALTVYTPATVTASQVKVEVEPTDTGTAFVTLQSGSVDVNLTAGTATVISPVPFLQMRITSTSVEAQKDTFSVTKTILV